MKTTSYGFLIELRYEDGIEDVYEWPVRGHVPFDVAIQRVQEWLQGELDGEERETVPAVGEPYHGWARWQWEGEDRVLRWGKEKGRGMFPVTVVQDTGFLAWRRGLRTAEEKAAATWEAHLRQWLPEMELRHIAGAASGHATARFKLPGLSGMVYWSTTRPGQVVLNESDRAAWERLYQGRPTRPGAELEP